LGQIINAVLPVFAIIGIGWMAGYRRVFDEKAAAVMNRFVFFFALPALIFRLLATAPIAEFSWPLLAAYFAGQLVVWLAAFAAMALIWKRPTAERVIGAASAGLPNHVFLALPIVIWLLGEAGTLPVLMIVALDSLVIYSLTLVLMEIATHDGPDRHPFRARPPRPRSSCWAATCRARGFPATGQCWRA
jgi:predicted permease